MPQYAVNNPWADNMRGVSALAQALGGLISPDNSRVLQAQLVGAQRDSVYADTDLTNQKRADLQRIAGGQERFAANLPALARLMVEGQTPPVSPIQVQGGAPPVQMGDGLTVSQGGPDMGGLAGLLGGPGAAGAGQLEIAPAAPPQQVQIPQSLLATLMGDMFIGANGDTRLMQNAPGVLMTAGGPQVLGGDADLSRILTGYGTPFQNTPEAFTRDQMRLETDSIRDNQTSIYNNDQDNRTQEYGYRTTAETQRRGQDINSADQRRGQDIDSADQRRGQDINSADTRFTAGLKPTGGAGGGQRRFTDGQEMAAVGTIREGLATAAGLGKDGEVAPHVVQDGVARFYRFYDTNGGNAADALARAIGDTPYMVKDGKVTGWDGKDKKARRGAGQPLYGKDAPGAAGAKPPPGYELINK